MGKYLIDKIKQDGTLLDLYAKALSEDVKLPDGISLDEYIASLEERLATGLVDTLEIVKGGTGAKNPLDAAYNLGVPELRPIDIEDYIIRASDLVDKVVPGTYRVVEDDWFITTYTVICYNIETDEEIYSDFYQGEVGTSPTILIPNIPSYVRDFEKAEEPEKLSKDPSKNIFKYYYKPIVIENYPIQILYIDNATDEILDTAIDTISNLDASLGDTITLDRDNYIDDVITKGVVEYEYEPGNEKNVLSIVLNETSNVFKVYYRAARLIITTDLIDKATDKVFNTSTAAADIELLGTEYIGYTDEEFRIEDTGYDGGIYTKTTYVLDSEYEKNVFTITLNDSSNVIKAYYDSVPFDVEYTIRYTYREDTGEYVLISDTNLVKVDNPYVGIAQTGSILSTDDYPQRQINGFLGMAQPDNMLIQWDPSLNVVNYAFEKSWIGLTSLNDEIMTLADTTDIPDPPGEVDPPDNPDIPPDPDTPEDIDEPDTVSITPMYGTLYVMQQDSIISQLFFGRVTRTVVGETTTTTPLRICYRLTTSTNFLGTTWKEVGMGSGSGSSSINEEAVVDLINSTIPNINGSVNTASYADRAGALQGILTTEQGGTGNNTGTAPYAEALTNSDGNFTFGINNGIPYIKKI